MACPPSPSPISWKVLPLPFSIPEMRFLVPLDSSAGGHQTQSESVLGMLLELSPSGSENHKISNFIAVGENVFYIQRMKSSPSSDGERIRAEFDSPVSDSLMFCLLHTSVSCDSVIQPLICERDTKILLIFFPLLLLLV